MSIVRLVDAENSEQFLEIDLLQIERLVHGLPFKPNEHNKWIPNKNPSLDENSAHLYLYLFDQQPDNKIGLMLITPELVNNLIQICRRINLVRNPSLFTCLLRIIIKHELHKDLIDDMKTIITKTIKGLFRDRPQWIEQVRYIVSENSNTLYDLFGLDDTFIDSCNIPFKYPTEEELYGLNDNVVIASDYFEDLPDIKRYTTHLMYQYNDDDELVEYRVTDQQIEKLCYAGSLRKKGSTKMCSLCGQQPQKGTQNKWIRLYFNEVDEVDEVNEVNEVDKDKYVTRRTGDIINLNAIPSNAQRNHHGHGCHHRF